MAFKILETITVGKNSLNVISNSPETQFNLSIDYLDKEGKPQTFYCFPIMVSKSKVMERLNPYKNY